MASFCCQPIGRALLGSSDNTEEILEEEDNVVVESFRDSNRIGRNHVGQVNAQQRGMQSAVDIWRQGSHMPSASVREAQDKGMTSVSRVKGEEQGR